MSKASKKGQIHSQNTLACVWDFDKTLIPGYMQTPLFNQFGVSEKIFWSEVNKLPQIYANRGLSVSAETIYLNHLLSYVKNGPMRGLTNQKLFELGNELEFYPGLPEFFDELALIPKENAYKDYDFKLEHYVISTGLSQMILGSKIAPHVQGIFASEFIESALPPNFLSQTDLSLPIDPEISQIGLAVDNTIKTRFIFEINKGCNKSSSIDVNSSIPHELRRIPFEQLIYVADGPSDVPVFAVVKQMGGKTYAVYDPNDESEFAQTCDLVESGRVHNNGPADYSFRSPTSVWMKQKIREILSTMRVKREESLRQNITAAPKHMPKPENIQESNEWKQETLWQ